MLIVDKIVGEIIQISDKKEATEEITNRLNYHNDDFNFGRFGRHHSCNAVVTFDGDTATIDYNKENI